MKPLMINAIDRNTNNHDNYQFYIINLINFLQQKVLKHRMMF